LGLGKAQPITFYLESFGAGIYRLSVEILEWNGASWVRYSHDWVPRTEYYESQFAGVHVILGDQVIGNNGKEYKGIAEEVHYNGN
jgi:hypothetical protein